MRTNTIASLVACSLSAMAGAALAAAPVFDVTCLDCNAGRPLKPLGISKTGVVVATDAVSCAFPGGCTGGQGYILDHGGVTPTPSFDAGALGSTVQAINSLNTVVGRASLSQWPQGPFGYSWDGVTMVNLGDTVNDYGDGYWSNATGVNDRGHVAGTAAGGYHYAVAFLYKKGLMTEVPPLPGSYINGPNSIIRVNLKDHVAGTSYRNIDDAHLAWMSKDGVTAQLAPDSDRSEAYAINDKDQVAGFMRVGTPLTHNDWPVIWKNGSAKLLNTLAGFDDHGQANAINNLGWAVGSACNKFTCTPFGFNGYKMFDLNTRLSGASTGWVLLEATAINDAGVIAGTGSFAGEVHAIMATPVTASSTP